MPQKLNTKRYTGRHADNCRKALQELLDLNKGYNVYIYWSKVQHANLKDLRNCDTGTFESKESWWAYTYNYVVFEDGTLVWDGSDDDDKMCFTKDNFEKVGDEYRFQLRSRPKVDRPNWMGQLRQILGPARQQELYLSSLTLPSTHNSHATSSNVSSWFAWAADVANCQSVGVCEQLEMGVRSIDLRVGKGLQLRHGKCDLKGHVRDVLQVMSDFLDSHPNETIMFQAKWDYWEDDSQPDQDQAPQEINDLIKRDFSRRGLILDQQPRLSDCAGKMVLFNDNGRGAWEPKGIGAPSVETKANFSDREAHWRLVQGVLEFVSRQANIQDGNFYEIPCAWQTLDRFSDWKKSWQHFWDLRKATRPFKFADFINPLTREWMRNHRNSGRLGRVMLDFAKDDIVHEALLWNFDHLH